MSHEVKTMMYAGETPWHKLGVKVEGLQTAEEAIIAAGLDWEVELFSIFSHWKRRIKKVDNRFNVRRISDGRSYNIVGNRYVPIQNREAFGFFDAVIGSGQAAYETAGSLRGGARIWIMANLTGDLDIAGDEVKRYLTLTNSHDGTGARQMWWTNIRTVCANTLQMALARGIGERIYARHTAGASSTKKVADAQEILGFVTKYYAEWEEQAQALAKFQLPAAMMPLLLKEAFGYGRAVKMEEIYNPIKIQMDKAKELIYVGRGQDNPRIQGTAWQAFNGIAEYADYYLPIRSSAEDARLQSLAFGNGAQIKKRAWDYLVKQL